MMSIVLRSILSLLFIGFLSQVQAATPPKKEVASVEDVDLRITAFDEIDRIFKALRFEVVNKRSTNREGAKEYSEQLVELSYLLPDTFNLPSSREIFPQSRSRPEIWSQKARFDGLIDVFIGNLEQIDDLIKTGDLSKAGWLIDETAKGCRRCHNAYRYK